MQISPPYVAVIFSSKRTSCGDEEYASMSQQMLDAVASQPGFLGVESVRDHEGNGITVSYWTDLDAVRQWAKFPDHLKAQAAGKSGWYSEFEVRICQVKKSWNWKKS